MQPWALELKLKGSREPSAEGQSQCDPGLERMVQRDQEAPEIEMDFWKQRLGGDWRLFAAVQQPSLESGGSQIDVFLSEYNIFDI